MQITAYTSNPNALFVNVAAHVKSTNSPTWDTRQTGSGSVAYTHTPVQWVDKVLILPQAHANAVTFVTEHWAGQPKPGIDMEGYVLCRFAETLMVHFRSQFDRLEMY